MISSLPGKASKMLVQSQGLLSDSTCNLEEERGKLNIKRLEPGILCISLQIVFTGLRSAVDNMSDCRSRDPKFDPDPVPFFRGD